jgi:hypothetical protein
MQAARKTREHSDRSARLHWKQINHAAGKREERRETNGIRHGRVVKQAAWLPPNHDPFDLIKRNVIITPVVETN